jgi:hypothetical protein
MAKGRFVSKQITIDKKVNDLKDPWSMLGFTWMIPHADCEGRLYGDPSVLKSVIFPRQNGNISVEEVEKMACDWHNAGLVIYYEDDCDRYIQLVNFEKHQTGLRKDREPASVIPRFNPETCRIIAGLNQVKLSLSEVKDKLSQEEVEGETPLLLHPNLSDYEFQNADNINIDDIFLQVTGFLPSKEKDNIRKTIMLIADRENIPINPKNKSKVADVLRPYFLEMCRRKNKNGQPYSRNGLFWLLEWAAIGEIPPIYEAKTKTETIADNNAKILQEAIDKYEAENG